MLPAEPVRHRQDAIRPLSGAVGRSWFAARSRPPYTAGILLEGKAMLGFILWLLLLFLCWPLALAALILYPLVWLLLLPFRLLGIGVEAVFAFLRAIVMLPARLLGGPR